MIEKAIIATVTTLVGIVMGFFWYVQRGQDKTIAEATKLGKDAHERITKQAERNNEKFARRDDVAQIERRLISALKDHIETIREDIRDIKNQKD